MGAVVTEISSESVQIEAPLKANINHRETAFGGSLNAIATLAGWALLHFRLRQEGFRGRLVIQRSQTDFHYPVEEDFIAVCHVPPEKEWAKFLAALKRRGRARVDLVSYVGPIDNPAVTLHGRFVAITLEPGSSYEVSG
ncbi:Putative thioesterase (yiiD_Cterm) [Calycomorphotria hydatis]|uniref:Thioesterase (YiiD_Cterm) n=2 Tax=Calycomorphotria hydatis TaxID=2528027 RepID=A0A517T6A6_9PLAN|nr:Putative thioesterase (yiiD_Cterm) [Calycomorphotria hydatis]